MVSGWPDFLADDPTDWLLEENNPSVRYHALRTLMELPEDDRQVVAAKRAIMESPCRHPRCPERRGLLGEAESYGRSIRNVVANRSVGFARGNGSDVAWRGRLCFGSWSAKKTFSIACAPAAPSIV
jgi:hypothetical protein